MQNDVLVDTLVAEMRHSMRNEDVYLAVSVMAMVFMGMILLGVFVCIACLPIAKIIRQVGNFFDSRESALSFFPTSAKNIETAAALAVGGVKQLKHGHVRYFPFRFTLHLSYCLLNCNRKKEKKKI
jgi:hypothetical protein